VATLSLDVGLGPWSLDQTLPLGRTLGLPVDGPSDERSTMVYLFWPRRTPAEIEAPLELHASGSAPASLMARERGFGELAQTDLLVSPRFLEVLGGARLRPHSSIECSVRVIKNFKAGAGMPFTWLWWSVPWSGVRFLESEFECHYADGTIESASFECFEDYEQVRKRSLGSGFALVPTHLARDEESESFDLELIGHRRWAISKPLASRMRDADLPGIVVSD